jgi:hypothetical protein
MLFLTLLPSPPPPPPNLPTGFNPAGVSCNSTVLPLPKGNTEQKLLRKRQLGAPDLRLLPGPDFACVFSLYLYCFGLGLRTGVLNTEESLAV